MFNITEEDIAKMHFDIDTSDIEDNDELFWNHGYTEENDNDGFPDYADELKNIIPNKNIEANISFMNTNL